MKRVRSQAMAVLIGALVLNVPEGQAQPRSGLAGTAGSPFRMGGNARLIGLGNAGVSIISGTAVFMNPALAPFLETRTAGVTAGLLTLDRYVHSLSYASRLEPTAGIMVGLISAGVGDIQGRNRDGQPTEVYSTSENMVSFSFGLKAGQHFAIGVSPKILYYSLFESVSSTTVGFDVGAVYRITGNLTLGISVQDLGSKYKWDTSRLYGVDGNTTTDQFPVRNRFGLSYADRETGLLAVVELEAVGSAHLLRGGVEWNPLPPLQLRAGLDQCFLDDDVLPKPSFGFSFEHAVDSWTPGLSYGYVLEPYGPGGLHFLTMTVIF